MFMDQYGFTGSNPLQNLTTRIKGKMLAKQNSEKLNSRNIFQYGIDLKSVFDIGEHYGQSARQLDVA